MSEDEPAIIRSETDIDKTKTLILVPAGTICFCRPIGREGQDDKYVLTGFETVWLRPNDAGIWEGVGPISGHVYRHITWLYDLMAQQHAAEASAKAQAELEEYWRERRQSRSYRVKHRIFSTWWQLRGWFFRLFHR